MEVGVGAFTSCDVKCAGAQGPSGLWPGTVVTQVAPAGPFWEAEAEHQDYLEHHPSLLYLK